MTLRQEKVVDRHPEVLRELGGGVEGRICPPGLQPEDEAPVDADRVRHVGERLLATMP
jgi:hypothetical protein